MREIKFRVWYAGTQFMDYRPNLVAGHFDDNEVDVNEGIADSGHPWMQFTGLKDKNGKEIYIGDILCLDLISGDRYSEVKVCDLREIPVVRYFPDEGWEPLYRYVGKPDTCLEIIGNIHESPELLDTV